ncbi:universal stress protein [Bifidobacterium simiarum]|uniref:universal stress protein n=1 Tax=Bifidobacterium simiarum TaxID=2045441 RepID=UPI001BDC3799|nr:universal stress protein [Bifidobacterium simiarum]MBT1165849.1 universal stress protein [Bifidobacterium simiarum]
MTESTEHVAGNGAGTYPGDIVVGVDGSDESFAALKWALAEAGRSGQKVNAVFAWTHSWDMGDEPSSEEAWTRMRGDISRSLREWVEQASEGVDFDPANLKLTSVKASGSTALLRMSDSAQQIVVGRRSLGRVARWLLGSVSSSLAEEAKVPVTVVRPGNDPATASVESDIAAALNPDSPDPAATTVSTPDDEHRLPVVVGIDGSKGSRRALDFAIGAAVTNDRPLQVLFCWQMKDLGQLPGYETTVPSVKEGQAHAEQVVRDAVAAADIPAGLDVQAHAFHIPAGKGMISASRYANRVIIGSRGLSGFDAHFLGSVSRQVVDGAECTVTVVH